MQSLSRALTVLDLLGRQASPLTLTDITKTVGLHKSTIHRMLATFVEYGLVRRDESNRYIVGNGAIDLARAARGESGVREIVQKPLVALARFTAQWAIYSAPRGNNMICLNAVRSRLDGQPLPTLGEVTPLHGTASGLAYLAHRPRYEIDRYAERLTFDIDGVGAIAGSFNLMSAVARIREQRYAVDCVGGVAGAVAVPVLGEDGFAIAAVVSGISSTSFGPDLRKLTDVTRACAEGISLALSRTSGLTPSREPANVSSGKA